MFVTYRPRLHLRAQNPWSNPQCLSFLFRGAHSESPRFAWTPPHALRSLKRFYKISCQAAERPAARTVPAGAIRRQLVLRSVDNPSLCPALNHQHPAVARSSGRSGSFEGVIGFWTRHSRTAQETHSRAGKSESSWPKRIALPAVNTSNSLHRIKNGNRRVHFSWNPTPPRPLLIPSNATP